MKKEVARDMGKERAMRGALRELERAMAAWEQGAPDVKIPILAADILRGMARGEI